MNNKKLLVAVVYRLPTACLEEFSDGFKELMREVSATGLDFIYFNFMVSYDLYPLVSLPTKISNHSTTLIDNIFVSLKYLNPSYADVTTYPGLDHLLVVGKITCVKRIAYTIKRNEL
jgi:hypothetical protein